MLFIFILFSVVFYFALERYYEKVSLQRIEQALIFDEATRNYIDTIQKPTINTLKNNGLLPHDFFDPKLQSTTYITNHINATSQKLLKQSLHNTHQNVLLKIVSDNPTNLHNKTNSFEQQVLQKFRNTHLKEYIQEVQLSNRASATFYAKPLQPNTKACLQCHGKPEDAPLQMQKMYGTTHGYNENVGHIRAMIAVYNPIEADKKTMMHFYYTIVIITFFISISIIFIIRYYTKIVHEKDAFITKQTKFAAMGEMISMIAHQWRQPLTGMGMAVENLKLDVELEDCNPERFSQTLETISQQILYLSTTIDDFRNFFKPNQQVQTFHLVKFLDETLLLIDSTLKKDGVEVIQKCPQNLTLTTHKNDLTQIVLNIVKNARDAYVLGNSQAKRQVFITVKEIQDGIVISIKDNAGGIKKEIQEKIFDPYFSTKDEKNGTGLGLYMSKLIIESHLDGSLELHSKDGSSEFILTLHNLKGKENGA